MAETDLMGSPLWVATATGRPETGIKHTFAKSGQFESDSTPYKKRTPSLTDSTMDSPGDQPNKLKKDAISSSPRLPPKIPESQRSAREVMPQRSCPHRTLSPATPRRKSRPQPDNTPEKKSKITCTSQHPDIIVPQNEASNSERVNVSYVRELERYTMKLEETLQHVLQSHCSGGNK